MTIICVFCVLFGIAIIIEYITSHKENRLVEIPLCEEKDDNCAGQDCTLCVKFSDAIKEKCKNHCKDCEGKLCQKCDNYKGAK